MITVHFTRTGPPGQQHFGAWLLVLCQQAKSSSSSPADVDILRLSVVDVNIHRTGTLRQLLVLLLSPGQQFFMPAACALQQSKATSSPASADIL
jgi:hypothetical protein